MMFCPLLNAPVGICTKALSALYTISEHVIADARRILQQMCAKPSQHDRTTLRNGVDGYQKNLGHPMNRYSDEIRDKLETHLDFILRVAPGASDGINTCGVSSPEISTQEKLQKTIAKHIEENKNIDVQISSSTIQRMVQDYLKPCNCRISFLQSDHNACPNGTAAQYSLL